MHPYSKRTEMSLVMSPRQPSAKAGVVIGTHLCVLFPQDSFSAGDIISDLLSIRN